MIKILLISVVSAAFLGCTPIETYKIPDRGQASYAQTIKSNKWQMQGRIVIKSDEVLSANIQWQHQDNEDKLKLSGLLGLGAVVIGLNERGVTLELGDGKSRLSSQVDNYIAQQIGFKVPITALRQWVLGSYLMDKPVVLLVDGFEQMGWRVTYKQYMRSTTHIVMPRKLEIVKGGVKLKLVVDQWKIE